MSVTSSAFAAGYSPSEAAAVSYFAKQPEPRKVREESAQIDSDVRTGTKAHEVSAKHLLSFSAAVKEGIDNAIGLATADGEIRHVQIFMATLPVKLPDETPFESDQVGREHLIFLSDTRA